MLNQLKKLGVGMTIVLNGRLVFFEFKELEQLKDTPFLTIPAEKVYELIFSPMAQGQLSLSIATLNHSLCKSKYLVLKLGDLSIFEIVDQDSELYKIIINKRSNLAVIPGTALKNKGGMPSPFPKGKPRIVTK